jgi:spore germination protein YaaH
VAGTNPGSGFLFACGRLLFINMVRLKFYSLSVIVWLSFSFSFILTANAEVEKLWYLKNEPRSMGSFEKNISKIDIAGPQTYYLLKGGEVRSVFPDKIIKLKDEKNKNLKVMPLLANISFTVTGKEYFDQKTVKNLLDEKTYWQKVSDYMRKEAKRNNFYGWQMDLENIPISHKDKFSEYIKFLRSEFDKDDLKLSIAVVSKISDNPKDYEKSYWQNWAGAYDWKVLAENTEFLSVMAYDEPNSPGPVATIQWSKKVLDYALKTIPKEKISFGIPVYSWAYRSEDLKNKKKHFSMVDFPFVYKKVFDSKKEDKGNMTTGQGMSKFYGNVSWVSYSVKGKNYTIWYEDEKSFKEKYFLIQNSGVRGFSVWVLGDEDPKIWEFF